ncbi:MAG: NB-ARC domain-containing protein, partial [Bacteroidota bacterium]
MAFIVRSYSYLLHICTCIGIWLVSLHHGLANSQAVPLPTNLLELRHSSSPYECAVLSAHVYQEAAKEGAAVFVEDNRTKHDLQGWKVLKTFHPDELSKAWQQLGLPYHCQAILYRNETKKQLVLAYRGATLSNTSSTAPDADTKPLIAVQEKVIIDLLTKALSIAQEQECSLTVTGHSLGGWLAQLTTFMAQQLYPEQHVKTIAFDSLGARPMLERFNAGPDAIQIDYLDITNYLSTPNLINAASPHVGTVFQVVFECFSRKPLMYNQQSHAVENFLRAFSPNTGTAYQCAFVQQWPLLLPISSVEVQDARSIRPSEVIHNLLSAFQQCTQGEALKSYKSFLRFVKKTFRYHSSPFAVTQQVSVDTTHTYVYKTRPCKLSDTHIRHIPRLARQFLIGIQRGAPANTKVAEQHPLVHAIQSHRQEDFVSIPMQQDIRLAVDQIISLTAEYPTLCTPTTLLPHLVLATNSLLPPPVVSFFAGRKALIKQLVKTFVSEKPLVIAPPITGPGGIGKSQLAIQVMAQQAMRQHYEHIFWISAEIPEKLQDAYLRMAEDLGLYVDKQNLKKVVQDVRMHLQNKHCLYVFDDAPSSEAIEGFLPLHRGHVLITSRNSNGKFWDVAPVLVAPLNEAEALELAQQYQHGNNEEEQKLIKTLLAEVPSYPLFLVQLFSILANEGIRPEAFLKNLKRYEAEMKDKKLVEWLAQDPYPQVHYDRGLSMLYVFKKSLERLSQEDKGAAAIQLLSQLAYLDPKGIPLDFILTLDEKDSSLLKRKTRAVLLLLEKYSLVQWDREAENVYIHAETQLIVRQLQPQDNFSELFESLIAYVGDVKEAYQHQNKWTALLIHGRAMCRRLDVTKCPEKFYDLFFCLSEACAIKCLFIEGLYWAKECLKVAQSLCLCNNDLRISQSLNNIGKLLHLGGRRRQALAHYQKALEML